MLKIVFVDNPIQWFHRRQITQVARASDTYSGVPCWITIMFGHHRDWWHKTHLILEIHLPLAPNDMGKYMLQGEHCHLCYLLPIESIQYLFT